MRRSSNATARVAEFLILEIDEQTGVTLFDNLTKENNRSKYQRIVATRRRLRSSNSQFADFAHEENFSRSV